MIDPHGFIYIDDSHYILASYADEVVEAVPDDLEAVDGSAYLAVLYMEEIQGGEILWEFCSADYPEFLSATTGNWTGTVPEWSMIEYSTTGEKLFTFRFNEGSRLLYCANKCE